MAKDDATRKAVRKAYRERNKTRIAAVLRRWKESKKPICHPDRKHKAHGLCSRCYEKAGYRLNKERRALCHPELPHSAKGLCKACYMAIYTKSYVRPKASEDKRREGSWRRNGIIGMSVAIYDLMAEEQKWSCAICFKKETTLHVDHDHATGIVRGLLCDYCNRRLLISRNSADVLRRAAEYLDDAKTGTIPGSAQIQEALCAPA